MSKAKKESNADRHRTASRQLLHLALFILHLIGERAIDSTPRWLPVIGERDECMCSFPVGSESRRS